MDLHWRDEDGKHASLYCGVLEVEVAFIAKANKWWSGFVWLPGVVLRHEYAPLDKMKSDIESQVQSWFGLANTSRPATDEDA